MLDDLSLEGFERRVGRSKEVSEQLLEQLIERAKRVPLILILPHLTDQKGSQMRSRLIEELGQGVRDNPTGHGSRLVSTKQFNRPDLQHRRGGIEGEFQLIGILQSMLGNWKKDPAAKLGFDFHTRNPVEIIAVCTGKQRNGLGNAIPILGAIDKDCNLSDGR